MDAGSLIFTGPGRRSSPWIGPLWMLVLVLLLSAACAGVLGSAAALTKGGWEAVWGYRKVFFAGWVLTILISIASLLASMVLGSVAALLRSSRVIPLRMGAVLYVELIRGTPLLAQILFLYYAVAASVGLQDRLTAGILILSLFSGAYLSEIIRAGIDSVPSTQLDSAKAVGFTRWQTYRYVILPQALRTVLPPLAGQFASLIKDSSLLSIIGIGEFTLAAQQVNSATYRTLESYLPLAAGYLALTLPISLLSRHLERRLRHED
jgi:polar amino acid transport system permease protein